MDVSLHQKLSSLQLPHMRDVCKFLGIRKNGNKNEIRSRLQTFLQSEEGRKKVPEVMAFLFGVKTGGNSGPVETVAAKVACICGSLGRATVQCRRCNTWQHAGCIGLAAGMKSYECPKCQTEQMDPFDPVLDFLLPPTTVPVFGSGDVVRPFTYAAAAQARVKDQSQRVFVQIRCLAMDKVGYTHQWPVEAGISVNGHLIFNATPQQPSQSRKRKDLPFDLTPFLNPTSHHTLQVYKKREDQFYALSVVLIQHLSVLEVMDRFRIEPALDVAQGKAFVASFMNDSYDLTTETLRLNLRCPLTHLKPEKPVRGLRCRHIQCFDFQSFVMLQESTKVNRWRCPICKEHCARLVRDLFIESIIEASQLPDNCDMVEFTPSGDFKLIHASTTAPSSDDSDLDLPRKRAKLATDAAQKPAELMPAQREDRRITWEEFVGRRVPNTRLHACSLYEGVSKMVLGSLGRLLQPRGDVAGTPVRGRVVTRTMQGSAGRGRSAGGSVACPIDLDE